MSKLLTIETKFAVFGAIEKHMRADRVRFVERGATIRPDRWPAVIWWVEGEIFHGELYTPDAQYVAKIEVPI